MPSAALLLCGLLGAHAARIQVHSRSRETVRDEYNCGRVKGATVRDSSWRRSWKCQCPEQQVVTGESRACKTLENTYSRYFDHTDAGIGDACKCAHKPGCGLVKYAVEDVIPANALEKGLPPPMEVGTRHNINTGIPELDAEFYGLWWMKDNPVPEELASMAGAFTEAYTGKNLSAQDAQWPVVVLVPNAQKNRWAWADNFVANNVIMPQYYGSDGKANFTMSSTRKGKIPTPMEKIPLFGVEEWGLDKINDDTWLRETTFKKVFGKNPLPDTNYTLTRILFENGTATKHFEVFEEHMKTFLPNVSQPLQVWDSDDTCKRKCMLSTHDCHYCHGCCTGGKDGMPKLTCRFGWRFGR